MKSPLDLSTRYLGIQLRSPFIVSASPLSRNLETLRQMDQSGAGAVVFHTLFEEPLESASSDPDSYCDQIATAKRQLSIPVIGSLNAKSLNGWIQLARSIELSGADALELNIYEMSLSITRPAHLIESLYVDTVQAVAKSVRIPVVVKLPPFFTNLAYVAKQLEEAGAKGLVLFNRFYLPDIDLNTKSSGHSLRLSTASENRLSLRWISLLYRPIQADLIANSGIRSGADVLKMILVGAAATEICSVLLQRGVSWLESMKEELEQAMEIAQVRSLAEARGMLSHRYTLEPGIVEQEEYQTALQGYTRFGVTPAGDPEI